MTWREFVYFGRETWHVWKTNEVSKEEKKEEWIRWRMEEWEGGKEERMLERKKKRNKRKPGRGK